MDLRHVQGGHGHGLHWRRCPQEIRRHPRSGPSRALPRCTFQFVCAAVRSARGFGVVGSVLWVVWGSFPHIMRILFLSHCSLFTFFPVWSTARAEPTYLRSTPSAAVCTVVRSCGRWQVIKTRLRLLHNCDGAVKQFI